MIITASSILIALGTSTMLIVLLSMILANKGSYKFFRIDFLSILIFITIIRLCVPVEQFYTVTIEAPLFMNPFSELLNTKLMNEISILHIILFIWVLGSLVKAKKLWDQIKQSDYLYECIRKNGVQSSIKDFLSDYSGKNFPVYRSSIISTPMVLLSKRTILLPDIEYSKEELTNILYHEITHINLHDAIIKRMIHILVVLYWWFPPIYKLEKQIDFFLELRVDAKVAKNMTNSERKKYLLTLLSVNKKNQGSFPATQVSPFAISESKDILEFRIEYFLEGCLVKKSKKIILSLLALLYIGSNLIVFEPSYPKSKMVENLLDINDFNYILHKKNGEYYLVSQDGTIIGKITDPNSNEFNDLEIRKEK